MGMDWTSVVQQVINEAIAEKELYKKSIYLSPNMNKDGRISSFSICLWEKDYPDFSSENTQPDKNFVVINIKDPALQSRPDTLRLMTMDLGVKLPPDIEFVDNVTPYWIIKKDSIYLRDYIKRLIIYSVDNYNPKVDTFGCCAKYNECSNAGRCLHENLLYSKACAYRKNLEAGLIFYGAKPITQN